jgi:hypothetical protein
MARTLAFLHLRLLRLEVEVKPDTGDDEQRRGPPCERLGSRSMSSAFYEHTMQQLVELADTHTDSCSIPRLPCRISIVRGSARQPPPRNHHRLPYSGEEASRCSIRSDWPCRLYERCAKRRHDVVVARISKQVETEEDTSWAYCLKSRRWTELSRDLFGPKRWRDFVRPDMFSTPVSVLSLEEGRDQLKRTSSRVGRAGWTALLVLHPRLAVLGPNSTRH